MQNFFKNIPVDTFLIWTGLIVVFWYLLTRLVISSSKRRTYLSIFGASFISLVILSSLLFIYVSIKFTFNYTDFFIHKSVYLILWIILLAVLIIATYLYIKFGKLIFRPENSFIGVAISMKKFEGEKYRLIISYRKLQIWLMLFLLGFAVLYFTYSINPKIQISLLMDNSVSMEEKIERGRKIIGDIFEKLPKNSEILLGTFYTGENFNMENTLNDIYNIDAPQKLNATSIQHFFTPKDLRRFLKNQKPQITDNDKESPISETLWALFLKAKNNFDKKIKHKALIVLTDGKGSLIKENMNYDIFGKQSNGQTISGYYDKIALINIGNNKKNPFFLSAPPGSEYHIKDISHLKKTLRLEMQNLMKPNWLYILFFAIPIIFFIFGVILSSMLIKHK